MMEASDVNVNEDESDGGEWPVITQSLYDFQRNIRAPKGFFGMRGKKDFRNANKRALMGLGVQQVCEYFSSPHTHFKAKFLFDLEP